MTKEDMSQPPDPHAAKLRSIEVALTDKSLPSIEIKGALGGVPWVELQGYAVAFSIFLLFFQISPFYFDFCHFVMIFLRWDAAYFFHGSDQKNFNFQN